MVPVSALTYYQDVLAATLPAGEGNSFHNLHLMRAANAAAKAGIPYGQFLADIMAIPHKRQVEERDCRCAYEKAQGTIGTFTPTPRFKPAIDDGKAKRQRIIDKKRGATEDDFSKASPVAIDWPIEQEAARVLWHLYEDKTVSLFIGNHDEAGIVGQTIRPVLHHGIRFESGCTTHPHIIPNPLTGKLARTKDGLKETYRGDNNVKSFRFCTVEFDDLSREDQLSFWASVDLPICALIGSGGKSIHAWLDVRQLASVSNLNEWQEHVGRRLYDQVLIPLGVDAACKNAARLSRLPGHYRTEKERWQKILYLSPEGRKVF